MLQILCSSVRVKLLARAKLIFLREQPDDFFFLWGALLNVLLSTLLSTQMYNRNMSLAV